MKRSANMMELCTGIGVEDAKVKKIFKRLKIPGTANLLQKDRFKSMFDCVSVSRLNDVDVPVLDVSKFLDHIEVKQPKLFQHLVSCLCPERLNTATGLVYIDEVTPGNVIAPDNARKSYLLYFTWLPLAHLRQDVFWFTVSVIRHDELQQLQHGLPQYVSHVLSFMKDSVFDVCRMKQSCLITNELYLVADEGALKLATDGKGASGMRPCLKCDVVSKARQGLDGFVSICEDDHTKFELSTDEYVLEIMQFLGELSAGPQSRLREYQTTAGFNYNCAVWFLQEDLRQLLPWQNITYDSMHCYFSNGICCQEIGYFYTACLASHVVSRQDFLNFVNRWWLPCFGSTRSAGLKRLVNEKLLKANSDYRGDASQTIELCSLMGHFAETCCHHDVLQAEVKSFLALVDVVNLVLQSKIDFSCAEAEGLANLQSIHMQLFKAAYPDCSRPKHHFQFHLEGQIKKAQCHVDCFPMERKNKMFKQMAPSIQRLSGFSQSCLFRLLERDLDRMKEQSVTPALIQPKNSRAPIDMNGLKCLQGTAIKCLDRKYETGQFILLNPTAAYRITACLQEFLGYILI